MNEIIRQKASNHPLFDNVKDKFYFINPSKIAVYRC